MPAARENPQVVTSPGPWELRGLVQKMMSRRVWGPTTCYSQLYASGKFLGDWSPWCVKGLWRQWGSDLLTQGLVILGSFSLPLSVVT